MERRSGRDRRRAEPKAPSGQRERRLGMEPRQPLVHELPATDEVMQAFHALLQAASPLRPPASAPDPAAVTRPLSQP